MGQSSLDDLAREIAGRQGRTLLPDPEPEKGYYYRSDHWYELSGMVQDLDLFHGMGLQLATTDAWPKWSETSEFRSKR